MFELAALWNGWQNIFTAEIDSYCQQVLTKRYPDTRHYGDFTTEHFRRIAGYSFRNKIKVLSAGLPCQPFSLAGKRNGLDDDRHLGPAFTQLCEVVRPPWVHLENVAEYIEVAFDDLASALEAQGYQVGEPLVLPAGGVGACHRRYRMFAIAHNPKYAREFANANGNGHRPKHRPGEDTGPAGADKIAEEERQRIWDEPGRDSKTSSHPNSQHGNLSGYGAGSAPFQQTQILRRIHPDADGQGLERERVRQPAAGRAGFGGWQEHWYEVATRICGMDDGHAARMDGSRSGVGPLAYSPTGRNRTARLKAGGNGLIPQIPYEFYRLIDQLEA
jgi:site-specific DNA-cytosine methylase